MTKDRDLTRLRSLRERSGLVVGGDGFEPPTYWV